MDLCWSRKCVCEHCEHVWIAAVGSVKLFPNLEVALKGVFNRVLNFFPNASGNAQEDALEESPCFPSQCEPFPDIRAHSGLACSPQLMSKRAQRRRRGRPPSRRQARTRDRAVTAGSLRHDLRPRVPAHFLRAYPARPPGQTVQGGTQARTAVLEWAARAHCQAGACYAR